MKIYDIASADKFELSSTSGDLDYGHRIDKVLDELKTERIIKVPFKWLYDIRQYDKSMDGCYMEITKVG